MNEMDFDTFSAIADEVAYELPEEFYYGLNGGVNIIPRIKRHPSSVEGSPIYILGEYVTTRETGRCIYIYYGSFIKTYGETTERMMRVRLRQTIRHEFRHHIETLAGENALELEDAQRLKRYLMN